MSAIPPTQLPPPGAATGAATGVEQATVDELAGDELAMEANILQSPFVQNVLPFLTSLLVHVGIIVLGLATYQAVKAATKIVNKEEYIIPEADTGDEGPEGGIPHPGLGGDPNRDAAQDQFPEITESQGLSETKGDKLVASLEGAAGDSTDGIIGTGAGTQLGHGKGNGIGNGEGGGGDLAPFGIPGGGGGIGPKSNFAGVGGRGRKIVFVCDATGSMMEHFDDLRSQLRKAIEPLKQNVRINVVFIQENAKPPIDPALLVATPENKRRLLAYVDGYTPKGPTEPIPAFKTALAMKPDLMYVFCDPSDFPKVDEIKALFRTAYADHKLKINTICFDTHEGEEILKTISTESGGTFRNLSAKELAED